MKTFNEYFKENKWWGYLHTNGKVQVKKVFSPSALSNYIEDADESPFVKNMIRDPIEANDYDDALQKIGDLLKSCKEEK